MSKISNLPEVVPNGTETIPAVRDGATVRANLGALTAPAIAQAEAARDAAIAAVDAIALPDNRFDTRAAAVAAVGGLAEGAAVLIYADEDHSGRATMNEVAGGAIVWKLNLYHSPAVIHVDNAGFDIASGLTPQSAVKTLAAAVARLKDGDTLSLARGSQWFEQLNIGQSDIAITTHGSGNRPIVDGALLITDPLTPDPVYPNVSYVDVVFDEATTGLSSNFSSAYHPMMWDEAVSDRSHDSSVHRVLNTDRHPSTGVNINVATQDELRAIVNANPGSFTVHRTGSANVEPRGDNGTTFRFYIHPRDGSDPNTNGRSLFVSQQKAVAIIGNGAKVEDVVFQRSGTKDMVGMKGDAAPKPAWMRRCDFLDPGCHAIVAWGIEFRNCRALAHLGHRDSYNQGGGAFHQFRPEDLFGPSRGFSIFDCFARGFSHAIYSHGNSGAIEHDTFDVDGFEAEDCTLVLTPGAVRKGIRARRIRAREIRSIAVAIPSGVKIEDSVFVMADLPTDTAAIFGVFGLNASARLENCLVFCPGKSTGQWLLADPLNIDGGAVQAQFPAITLVDSTITGLFPNPGNANRNRYSLALGNSILKTIDGQWLTGTITTDATSSLEYLQASTEDVQAQYPGIDPDTLSGVVRQVWEKTITAADLNFVNTNRNATYGGVDNGNGTANLAMDFNDRSYGRYIRVVDAYGAGQHYEGRIVDPGAGSGDPIIVAPPPIAAFANKPLHRALLAHYVFRDPITALAISQDGTQLRVADPSQFRVGMPIRIGPVGLSLKTVTRRVNAIAGNIVSIDQAVSWKSSRNAYDYTNLDGSNPRRALPTPDISWGFPLQMRVDAGLNFPSYSVAPVEGGAALTSKQNTFGTGQFNDVATQVNVAFQPNGTQAQDNAFDPEGGYFSTGFGVAVGDVLTLTANAEIADFQFRYLVDPVQAGGAYVPDPECLAVQRGAGFRGFA